MSEQTRGHGREPIAEVLRVWEASDNDGAGLSERGAKGRVEAGVPDLCTSAANVLARVQTSYSELFSSLTRVVVQGVRSLPVRNVSFQQGTIGAHVATIMKMLTMGISKGFNREEVVSAIRSSKISSGSMDNAGIAMYLGCLLSHLHSCLFEEKRERRMVNVPLLIVLSNAHNDQTSPDSDKQGDSTVSFFDAIRFVYEQSLCDFRIRALGEETEENNDLPQQRLSRTTAACLPSATSVLRRLLSGPSITSSPVSSVLSRVKVSDLAILLGEKDLSETSNQASAADEDTFSPEKFSRSLLCSVSKTAMELWVDPRFVVAPPYIAHPIATLVAEIMSSLEESTKKAGSNQTTRSARGESALWNPFRNIAQANRPSENAESSNAEEEFEVSDDAVNRLVEMGFSTDHAWDAVDSTRSNRLEVAMEYALAHPPPSPSAIQRRRAAREERRRQRNQQSTDNGNEDSTSGVPNLEDVTRNSQAEAEGQENGDGETARSMDVENAESNTSETESKTKEDATISLAKSCLELWKTEATKISIDILAGTSADDVDTITLRADDGKGQGNSEVEALTVVLCSFLLDLCQRYPSERDRIASELFARMNDQLVEDTGDGSTGCTVKHGAEGSFAALCHGAVLFTRALPKTRTLVLKEGLVCRIISCFQGFIKQET